MQVEFYVCVDKNGDVGFGTDEDGAIERYADNIGGNECRRVVKIVLDVPFSVLLTTSPSVSREWTAKRPTVGEWKASGQRWPFAVEVAES